jgi:hypothetical protein
MWWYWKYIYIYRVFLSPPHRARRLDRTARLHPPRHLATTAVLRTAMREKCTVVPHIPTSALEGGKFSAPIQFQLNDTEGQTGAVPAAKPKEGQLATTAEMS